MGLDIYLYRYDDLEKSKKLQEEFQRREKEIWDGYDDGEKYDSLTDDQKKEYRTKVKEMAASLGLDEWGDDADAKEQVEMDSKLFPKHMFKIGYFRSSYNEGGIERILKNFGLPTLYDIFEITDKHQYQIKPDWEQALNNVVSTIFKLGAKGNYRVRPLYIHNYNDNHPKNPKEALDIFLSELESKKESEEKGHEPYNYSNGKGEFNLAEPEKVLAYIPGENRYIFNDRPCMFVVTESSNEWYIQALEIVKETIEYVLKQENKEQYCLHWSS